MKNVPEERREHHKRDLVRSGFAFAGGFAVVVVTVFLLLIVTDPENWINFIVNSVDEELSLLMSLFFLFTISYLYFYYDDREVLYHSGYIVLFFLLVIFSSLLCWVYGSFVSLYARPYALFAMLCLFLLGRKHALFLNFIFVLLMFALDLFMGGFSQTIGIDTYAVLLIGFVSGTFAVFVASRVKTRLGILGAGVLVAVTSALLVLFFKLPNIRTDGWVDYVASTGFRVLGALISSALTLTLLPLFEAMFNLLTPFRLRELTSTNAPLLARLKAEAPGTFNHSLIVAQLSESCAVAIGENAELARAAAYYHDVGKLKQPDCFTENQTDYNVHNELTPELSADIIRSHTNDGYDLLIQSHLPRQIADVAREHHGTLPIKYFYDKALRLTGGEANIRDYSYFGPVPQTKIAAIVMISDAAEAATRALADRAPESVEQTVRGIIEERMDLDQFTECDITIRELTVIKQALVDALSGVHHHRVEYPELRFNRARHTAGEEARGKKDE